MLKLLRHISLMFDTNIGQLGGEGSFRFDATAETKVIAKKTFQPIASYNQLASIAYDQTLALEAGEVFSYPRT